MHPSLECNSVQPIRYLLMQIYWFCRMMHDTLATDRATNMRSYL